MNLESISVSRELVQHIITSLSFKSFGFNGQLTNSELHSSAKDLPLFSDLFVIVRSPTLLPLMQSAVDLPIFPAPTTKNLTLDRSCPKTRLASSTETELIDAGLLPMCVSDLIFFPVFSAFWNKRFSLGPAVPFF